MKRTRSLCSLFLLIFTVGFAVEGLMLATCEAQRPGQLSSNRGKRWFEKKAPAKARGLLSSGVEKRKARRKAIRQQAITEARAEAGQTSQAGAAKTTADGARAHTTGDGTSTASTKASSHPKATMMRRTTGRRGGGSGPTKRRRSLLTPLFGD